MKALTDITLDYLQPNPEERKKELDGYFTELKEHAADWEVKEFRSSNDRLYSILQKCYATALEMMGTEPSHEKMKKSFSDYCESKGYNFQDSTPLVQRIVRVVFAEPNEKSWNRSRISTYGKALVVLFDNNVQPEDVVDVIKDHGGLEEVKRTEGELGKPEDFSKRGKKVVEQKKTLASLTSRELVFSLDSSKKSEVVLLVATRVGSTFEIRDVVQKEAVVKSVLKDIGKRHKNLDIDLDEPEQDNNEPSEPDFTLDDALAENNTLTVPSTRDKPIGVSSMARGLSAAAKKEPEPA